MASRFLSAGLRLLGSIPSVGKAVKKTATKASSTLKNIKSKASSKKQKVAKKLKNAKKKLKKKGIFAIGKVVTKARKIKNNLSNNESIQKLKLAMKAAVLVSKVNNNKLQSNKKNTKEFNEFKPILIDINSLQRNGEPTFKQKATSFLLDFMPLIGTAKGAQQAWTGENEITGEKLTKGDRIAEGVGVAASIVPGGKLVGTYGTKAVIKVAETVADVGNSISNKAQDVIKGMDNPASRLPRTNGTWDGQPGNGKWYSGNPEVKEITGGQPVEFKNGRPDFSPWSELDITFKKGELNGTRQDFDLVYNKVKDMVGLKNKTQARNWLSEQGLTPHHLDDKTIQLIPTKLHGNIPHIGSASDLRGGY